MNERIKSFDPVVTTETKVLIIGSIPGVKSLEENQYYGHPRNAFWMIMEEIFEKTFCDYEDKITFIKENRLGLWDALGYANRIGSLDSNIKKEVNNDFETLFQNFPNIKYVICNGKKAYQSFLKLSKEKGFKCEVYYLPSTSPAYTLSFQDKLESWKIIERLI